MKTWTDNNYGANADGNRGTTVTMYELENTQQEKFDIASVLFHQGVASDETGYKEIEFEGIEIEVDVEEYSHLIKGLEDADDAISEMLK